MGITCQECDGECYGKANVKKRRNWEIDHINSDQMDLYLNDTYARDPNTISYYVELYSANN